MEDYENLLKLKESTEFLGFKSFNVPSNLFIQSKIFEKSICDSANEGIFFNKEYSVFLASKGLGNEPIFISCNQYEKIDLGDNELYVKPLEESEVYTILSDMQDSKEDFLESFAEDYLGLSTKKVTLDTLKYKIVELHKRKTKPLFLKQILPISIKELKGIDDFYDLIAKCLHKGINGDRQILDTYISTIPEVNPEMIKAPTFMKYANHGLMVTNSAIGKTTTATLITDEPTISDFSIANLIGFADAKKKVEGKLHNRTKPTFLDEMGEQLDNELLGKLHTNMEQGECANQKGLGVKCRSYSTLFFQGNPKIPKGDDTNLASLLMLKQFRDFLLKISSNIKPFSKRIGEVDVGKNFKEVLGVGVSEESQGKIKQIIRTIAEGFKNEFSELIKNKFVIDWMNESYEQSYLDKINALILNCGDNLIREFLEGQKINYRHVRGGAIKRAWLQVGISRYLETKKLPVQEIIECAEIHFNNRIARNLKSYAAIMDLLSSDVYEQIIQMNLENLKPEYAKLMFYSLFEYAASKESLEKIIPISLLEDSFNILKNKMEISIKYQYFSRVKEYFGEHVNHLNFYFEEFGILYDSTLQGFIINDSLCFNKTLKTYKKLYGTKGTISTESTIGTKGTVVSKNTEISDGTKSVEKGSQQAIDCTMVKHDCTDCTSDLLFSQNQKSENKKLVQSVQLKEQHIFSESTIKEIQDQCAAEAGAVINREASNGN